MTLKNTFIYRCQILGGERFSCEKSNFINILDFRGLVVIWTIPTDSWCQGMFLDMIPSSSTDMMTLSHPWARKSTKSRNSDIQSRWKFGSSYAVPLTLRFWERSCGWCYFVIFDQSATCIYKFIYIYIYIYNGFFKCMSKTKDLWT